jgi:hypothetical protein
MTVSARQIPDRVETEWAVRWPETDDEPESVEECHDEECGRRIVAEHPGWHGVVVSRTVTYSPWVSA